MLLLLQVLYMQYINTVLMAELLIKHKAKPSASLALRPNANCFILCIAQARHCFKNFHEY